MLHYKARNQQTFRKEWATLFVYNVIGVNIVIWILKRSDGKDLPC